LQHAQRHSHHQRGHVDAQPVEHHEQQWNYQDRDQ
jgi:hypothetical protein